MSEPIDIVLHRPYREELLLLKISSLKEDLRDLEKQLDRLHRDIRDLENKLSVELYVNNECIDLLKMHKIPFRAALDRARKK